MDDDRQAILNQKRQRLQELRQRRAELSSSGTVNFSASPEPLPRTRVDVSVQVDLIPQSEDASEVHVPTIESSQTIRFEKGIQTDESPIDEVENSAIGIETQATPNIDQEQTLGQLNAPIESKETKTNFSDELKNQLSAWNVEIPFSDLRMGVPPQSAIDSTTSAPFRVKSQLRDFIKRPIVQIASSPHFLELVLVAYGKSDTLKRSGESSAVLLAGLAIVYNTKADVLVPEFFLQCASPISFVTFDKGNPAKVFAGLENGSIAMWDLANVKLSQIALLPTLQTSSIVSQDEENSSLEVINHSSPILYLGQPMWKESQDPTLVSICFRGVVNMWSPNLLAFPKLPSLQIGPLSARINEQLFVSTFTVASNTLYQLEKSEQSKLPEYRFLDLAYLGSRNGSIFRTCNNADSLYLGDKVSTPEKLGMPHSSEIKALVEMGNENKVLLSFHSDWTFRIWNSLTNELLYTVPTTAAIRGVSVRPQHNYQFVTIGDMKPPNVGLCVEYWDLEVRLFSSVLMISTEQSRSGTAVFSEDGETLFVAYENGDIDAWDVDEEILVVHSSQRKKTTVDKGIASMVFLNKQSIET